MCGAAQILLLSFASLSLATSCQHWLVMDPDAPIREYTATTPHANSWLRQISDIYSPPPNAFRIESAAKDGSDIVASDAWTEVGHFIHISDVQVRDARLHFEYGLFGRTLPDCVAGGVMRATDLDANDEYPFIALVGAINSLDDEARPAFVVHTGDAIDVGTKGELLRFLSIANALSSPWIAAVGNHDHYFMGTFHEGTLAMRGIDDSDLISEAHEFARMHRIPQHGVEPGFTRADSILDPHYYTHEPTLDRFESQSHGFDMGPFRPDSRYYSLEDSLGGIPFRYVALDTSMPSDRPIALPNLGAEGVIDHDQFVWLKHQFAAAREREQLVLILGHHPLADNGQPLMVFERGSRPVALERVLRESIHDNVIGYFCGHTHQPELRLHTRENGRRNLLEAVAPSLHECPQCCFRVRLLRGANDRLAISIDAIRGIIDEQLPALHHPWRKAVLGSIQEAREHNFDKQLRHTITDGHNAGQLVASRAMCGFFEISK